jgi:ankyrin repeat protein
MLVGHKADINATDDDGNTPLHYASEFGHFECIIFLIKEAGSDPMVKNKFDYTPSDIA